MKKTVLITGVSTGIGAALCQVLLDRGYNVIGTVRKKQDAVAFETSPSFFPIVMDVTDRSAIGLLMEVIETTCGENPLFALVNNAGIAIAGPMEFLPDEEFERLIDINVLAVRRITNAALNKMTEGSRIVNISSVSGLFNSPFTGAYCISKHALESMTDVYRRELMSFGIQVSAIEPGPIKTPIWSKSKGTLDRFSNTRYGILLRNADKIIDNAEKSGQEVGVITDAVLHALESPIAKPRYLIHSRPFLFKIVSRFLSDRWADKLVARTLRGGNKHRAI